MGMSCSKFKSETFFLLFAAIITLGKWTNFHIWKREVSTTKMSWNGSVNIFALYGTKMFSKYIGEICRSTCFFNALLGI